MSNKRFYIIAGIVLALVLGAVAVMDMSSEPSTRSGSDDQGLRITP